MSISAKEFFSRLLPSAELAEIVGADGKQIDIDAVTIDGFLPIGENGEPDESRFVDAKYLT